MTQNNGHQLLDIQLGLRTPGHSHAGPGASQAVLKRDGNRCRFCGFVSRAHVRVIPDPTKSKEGSKDGADSFVTACLLCDLTMDLEEAARRDAGYIAYIPELTQAEVNHLAHACQAWKTMGSADHATTATMAEGWLRQRVWEVGHISGKGTHNVDRMARALAELDPEDYKNRGDALKHLRFVPRWNSLAEESRDWSEKIYSNIPSTSWQRLVTQYLAKETNSA